MKTERERQLESALRSIAGLDFGVFGVAVRIARETLDDEVAGGTTTTDAPHSIGYVGYEDLPQQRDALESFEVIYDRAFNRREKHESDNAINHLRRIINREAEYVRRALAQSGEGRVPEGFICSRCYGSGLVSHRRKDSEVVAIDCPVCRPLTPK